MKTSMGKKILFVLLYCAFAQYSSAQLSTYKKLPSKLDRITTYQPDSIRVSAQPSVFSVERLPFFCKHEYALDQKSKMKIRFRLGSVDYVDRLEGKKE